MYSHPTANNLICTEPSPKTPTEKFFESEVASNSSPFNSSSINDEPTMSSGESVNGNSGNVAGGDCTSSPTLSDASSSGYESLLDDSSQPDNSSELLSEVFSESHSAQKQQQQELLPASVEEIYYTAAPRDSPILDDFRATQQMLLIEDRYVPWGVDEQVYKCGKYESDEKARRIVTEWMLEVCEELKCEEVIFSLAVNYLDRFILSTPELRKFQLQLVAIVCLLIASKLRQCESLNPKELSDMSENSVTVKQILSWEPLVLKRLNWDVSSVLAIDYLDHILVKLPELCHSTSASGQHQHPNSVYGCPTSHYTPSPLRTSNILSQSSPSTFSSSSSSAAISSPTRSTKRPFWAMASFNPSSSSSPAFSSSPPPLLAPYSQQKRFRSSEHSCKQSDMQSFWSNSVTSNLHDTVRRHASTLISLCSTELQFACVRPSVIAAACVATAVRGILQRAQCSHSIDSTFAFFSAQLQIDIDSENIRFCMNQIERLLALRFPKFSNGNSSEHPLANTTSAADVKTSSKTLVADEKHYYQPNQHRVHPLEQHYHHQQHLHPYLPYRSSAPVHHHSPIHSTNGHSPNASCIGGTAAASAAAAAAAAASSITSMHSPSRFSPITFLHCNVPTAQVISAKMLLLEQQRSPPNRAYHLRQQQQQQQQQHPHIPEALPFLARCSAQSSVSHNHLHDSSNTSTFSSSSSSLSSGSGNDNFDNDSIFKSKQINFNCLSEDFGGFITTGTHLLSPSTEQFDDDEDRENMAPSSAGALAGESSTLLFSTEDLSELSDDEDGNLHGFY